MPTNNNLANHLKSAFIYVLKWVLLSLVIGVLAGSASALFLISLEWATGYRMSNPLIVWLLPVGGLIIGLSYHYFGKEVVKGNNQILDEYHKPKKIIPIIMAPLVLIGTVITHLFGGSAGREGTAVQMGSSIADQFSRLFKIDSIDRKILLIIGISAGFSSVFGTPLAGTVFALEVLIIGRMRYEAILPSLITAIIANYACTWWGVGHTQYSIPVVPEMELDLILWSILAGVIFGLSAMLFSKGTHFFGNQFKKFIKYPPLRPVVGGLILATAFWAIGTSKYMGLGVPIIEEAFTHNMEWYDFLAKILFTTFTLGAGFKGGEVTPLFYIGAVLGSALALILPLPVALLAGMGFVGVFSGATNTPIACTLMGIELFGIEAGMFIAIACFTAYLFSGHSSIYGSQVVGSPKSDKLLNEKGEILSDL